MADANKLMAFLKWNSPAYYNSLLEVQNYYFDMGFRFDGAMKIIQQWYYQPMYKNFW